MFLFICLFVKFFVSSILFCLFVVVVVVVFFFYFNFFFFFHHERIAARFYTNRTILLHRFIVMTKVSFTKPCLRGFVVALFSRSGLHFYVYQQKISCIKIFAGKHMVC